MSYFVANIEIYWSDIEDGTMSELTNNFRCSYFSVSELSKTASHDYVFCICFASRGNLYNVLICFEYPSRLNSLYLFLVLHKFTMS